MKITLLTFLLFVATQHMTGQSAGLVEPRLILNLGSNVTDGSISLACAGEDPYPKLSCKVYRLWLERPTPEEYRQSRSALAKDLASKSDEELRKAFQAGCSKLPAINSDLAKNLKAYSPGRAASAQDGYQQMKAVCGCTTKQCITSVMLEQQTHDQNQCTIHSAAFPVDFVKVSARKWVSNNGPEGICGAVSVFSIEHEPDGGTLWTYSEQFTFTNNSEGLCKGLKDQPPTIYSWKSGSHVRLNCEDIKFDTTPEWQ